jgi:hypothetical protein
MTDVNDRVSISIDDLEDVKAVMTILGEIRDNESYVDEIIGPIEDAYSMLICYEASQCSTSPFHHTSQCPTPCK